ncbi:MAG TPA: prolyl oligopeptidase family serine peptidase, partial [Longimicrobiales bacterium]|nr:prolyl oligopeptidase family serine peptidase [Longimicrobiales bacterium]
MHRPARHLRSRSLTTILLVAAATAVLPLPATAQDASTDRRPLEIADYHLWRSIGGEAISSDGAHVAWTYSRLRSDDTLHIRRLADGETTIIPRGSSARFSDDGAWVAYEISAAWDDEDGEQRVGLMDLASGRQWSWTGPGSFGFSPGSSHFWLMKRTGDEDADGSDLVLRNLAQAYDELIGGVDEYGWNESGSFLAYTVDAADGDGNGLYLLEAATGARRALDNADARYAQLSWAGDGTGLAVLRGETPEGMTRRANSVVVVRDPGIAAPEVTVIEAPEGLREGWVVSERAGLEWSDDAGILFVGTIEQEEELADWSDDGLPLADVNIWHWDDDRIQAQQQRMLGRDRTRTDLAALHLDEERLVHIETEDERITDITPDGTWAVLRDGSPHVSDWRPAYGDFVRMDVATGERTPMLERQLRTLGMSPDGAWWLYWRDGDVWAYDMDADGHSNLSANSGVEFADAEYDYHGEHPPYGVEGWVGSDADGAEGVVLAHRYDLWLQPLDGSSEALLLTGGVGATDRMRMRVVDTDADADWIDLNEPVLLSAFRERTKEQGWYELREIGTVARITLEDAAFSGLDKAADADVFLYTRETFRDFPDLHVSGPNLRERERITDANPQQDEYLWGDRILFDYELADGTALQGILAVPETRAEGERRPMIVRFYEKMSDQLHQYPTPAHRHSPNFAGYVSNGYLIMQPDVHFRVGSSHSDMLEAVEAATRAVIDMGYADPDAIGLSGHSYSGGGGAYIATRSDMFAAVAHGAAPINLVSEFNQLFVGSGQNNHRYDIYGQGRYATNPYDDFDLYWEQSPISGVEDMDTPVLYLHGEDDPTVNWEQGLEWYNALRFLGKPIIWLSYPDEGHGLSRLENRIDFQYRLRQFFDHHLSGAPAPSWMIDGVPQTEKQRHLREFAPRIFTG